METKVSEFKEKLGFSSHVFGFTNLFKFLLISGLLIYLIFILFFNNPNCPVLPSSSINLVDSDDRNYSSPTNLSHLVFGLVGSERAWHQRRAYIETWWRPSTMRGYLFLDKAPTWNLLPWSSASPPYRVSKNLAGIYQHVTPFRIVHGIMEAFNEANGDFRWLVMGDDDSIFMLGNMVDLLSKYDHTKYYYFGGQSEFILSNYWYSFNQGFGGAGFILSYPLAKALAKDMENCLSRYSHLKIADLITMLCIADIGVNLSPNKGIHQIDLRGDISGFLSSHPKTPLISLHHFDAVDPIFPSKDRYQSARHIMKAATFDQPRMLQQTICHNRENNWSLSISWGYSVHIYEKIIPRSWLQLPIETFRVWQPHPQPPHYMFNTRSVSYDPCEAPHVFYLNYVKKTSSGNAILTVYSRASPRGLSACLGNSSNSADYVSTIKVLSPATRPVENGRCECCDIIHAAGSKTVNVKYRQCMTNEIIA